MAKESSEGVATTAKADKEVVTQKIAEAIPTTTAKRVYSPDSSDDEQEIKPKKAKTSSTPSVKTKEELALAAELFGDDSE